LKAKKCNVLGTRRKAREMAVQAFYQYDFGYMGIEELKSLQWLAGEHKPALKVKEYFYQLLEGINHFYAIDEAIKKALKKDDFNQIMAIDRAVLRVITSCLLFEKKTPAVILINEGVELAKLFGGKDAYKFINGVLNEIRKQLVEQGERLLEEFARRDS